MNTASTRDASMPSFDAFQRNGYFGALDGLRGLAILLVVFHHSAYFEPGLAAIFHSNSRYGVSLFFVISGFLITTLLIREERDNGRIDLPRFYARRALRLFPLYYAVLLLNILLIFGLNQYTPENQALFRYKLPSYLLYYSNWLETATHGPFFCAWTLAVEEQFYLGFSLMLMFIPRRLIVPLVTGALVIKFATYQMFGSVDAYSTAARVFFSYQEAILWGVLLAFALNHRPVFDMAARLLRSNWTVAGFALLGLTWLVTRPMETSSTWDAELLYVFMVLVTAGVVIRSRLPLLSSGMLAHIGKVSYGIYLLHMLVISVIKKMPNGTNALFCFVASTVIVVAIASLVHRCFERPIITYYKRRMAPRKVTADAPAAIPGTPQIFENSLLPVNMTESVQAHPRGFFHPETESSFKSARTVS